MTKNSKTTPAGQLPEKPITEDELLAATPRVKRALKERVEQAKKKAEDNPRSVKLAQEYKLRAIELLNFMEILELVGRLALSNRALTGALHVYQEIVASKEKAEAEIGVLSPGSKKFN